MKTKKKILWLDLWQIAEQEAWLSDMAAKGWELTKMNRLTAHFKKAAPQTVTFKTDIFKEPINQNSERLEQYELAGWKYVASRGPLHFFWKPDSSGEEIHTEPIHQAETIYLLKRTLKVRAYGIFLFSLIGIALAIFMLTLDPVRNYLNDDFLFPVIQIFIFVGINFIILKGLIHLNKLIRMLQSDKRIQPGTDYGKKYLLNKILGISLLTFFAVVLIYELSKSGNIPLAKSFPPIPKEELPVVKIVDFTDKSFQEPYSHEGKINRDNFYFVSSSILVPLHFSIPFPDLLNLASAFWLKIRLGQYIDATSRKGLNATAFDELYVLDNSIISRKDHIIYYVTYYGKEPIEKIISAMEQKITEEKQRS